MTLLLTLLIFALAFTIFGGIVGYVAGVNRRFELDETDGRVNLATGGYNPLWEVRR